MPVLTNLEAVKLRLDLAEEEEQDDILSAIIDEVDEVIANELPRGRVPGWHPITSVEGTEYYDGSGRERQLLRRRPVTAIARVAVDQNGYYGRPAAAFPASTDWVEGTDFVSVSLDESEENPGVLLSLRSRVWAYEGGAWPEGRGNILVQYTAGYTTIPNDLRLLANLLVEATWNTHGTGLGGPLASMRLGDASYRLLMEDEGPSMVRARRILAKYRE